MSELRKDPVSQRWVIVSISKGRSPAHYEYKKATITQADNCPFCEHNSDKIETEIYRRNIEGKWAARIVDNKFPALVEHVVLDKYADGIYDKMSGYGIHEVIIDSYHHDVPFHKIGIKQMDVVIKSIIKRYRTLKKDKDLKYVLFFKNYGESAGASLSHSHMQLIATPVIPKTVQEELRSTEKYYAYKERCLFCDLIKQELKDKERLIDENNTFVSFVPYAPRFPFECWIFPKKHSCSIDDMKMDEITDLSNILKDCLNRLQNIFPELPYNFVVHTAPFTDKCRKYYHWHIEIMPRLTKIAGFEWGSGFYITETAPEKAAMFLRKVELGEKI